MLRVFFPVLQPSRLRDQLSLLRDMGLSKLNKLDLELKPLPQQDILALALELAFELTIGSSTASLASYALATF